MPDDSDTDADQPQPVVQLASNIYPDGSVQTDVIGPDGLVFSFSGSVEAAANVNQEAVAEQIEAYFSLVEAPVETEEEKEESADLSPETATPG